MSTTEVHQVMRNLGYTDGQIRTIENRVGGNLVAMRDDKIVHDYGQGFTFLNHRPDEPCTVVERLMGPACRTPAQLAAAIRARGGPISKYEAYLLGQNPVPPEELEAAAAARAPGAEEIAADALRHEHRYMHAEIAGLDLPKTEALTLVSACAHVKVATIQHEASGPPWIVWDELEHD
jgi:hypothetical protein